MTFVMKQTRSKFLLIAVGGILLSACGSTPNNQNTKDVQANQSTVENKVEDTQIIAELNLSPKQRMSKAVSSLERGDSEIAKVELLEYQKAVPSSRRAAILLKQLSTPADEYYPEEFFTLTLRSGQSLSTLAKKYLGTAWEFYALAKYNQIDNPSRVNIGTEIKIPLTQLAQKVKLQEEREEQVAKERLISEQATLSAEDEAFSVDEPKLIAQEDSVVDLSPNELLSKIQEATLTGNYADAASFLSELEAGDNLSEDILQQVKTNKISLLRLRAETSLETDQEQASVWLAELGELQLESDQELEAFESYRAAKTADETNLLAAQQYVKLKEKISENYHREASVSFRKQELDDAIAKWDVVLEVDPEHSNALAYRSQAIDLKKRLEALNK